MKFSGKIDIVCSLTHKCIVTMDIDNVVSMATYLQYSVKSFYIFLYNLKTICANFMEFSGEIDIVWSLTYKCIITMDIN